MEPRGIFSMAVPAEVLAAALAEDGSRRSWPGAVPDYCFTADGRRMLYDVKRISFCPSRYWPTVAVASSRGGMLESQGFPRSYGVRGGSFCARCPHSFLVQTDGDRRPSRSTDGSRYPRLVPSGSRVCPVSPGVFYRYCAGTYRYNIPVQHVALLNRPRAGPALVCEVLVLM